MQLVALVGCLIVLVEKYFTMHCQGGGYYMKVRVVISFDFSDKHRESLAYYGWWTGVKEKDGIVRVTREELQNCIRMFGDPNVENNNYDDLLGGG